MKRLLAAATTAAVLGAGGVAVASAAGPEGDGASGAPPPATGLPGGPDARRARIQEGLRVAAETIGILTEDLVAAIKGGATIAAVAGEHGVDPQAVVDALAARAEEAIAAAVAAGRLDESRAAELRERLPDLLARVVHETPHHRAGAGAPGAPGGARARMARRAFGVAAETIGVEQRALFEAVRGGATVADVAAEHGVDPQAVIDALVGAATERISDLATRFVTEPHPGPAGAQEPSGPASSAPPDAPS